MFFFKTIKKKIRNKFLFLFLKFKNHSIKNVIILTSEPRSGSTWLMEIFGSLPNCIINWEPLQVSSGVVPKKFKLGNRPYIEERDSTKKYNELFKQILTLKKSNRWTTRYISIKKLISSKHIITKFVRANSLLPWFTTSFDFKHKPVLLLRHPIPTCVSQLRNFHKETSFSISEPFREQYKFMPPDCINNYRYNKHTEFINTLTTPLERQIAIWCVNNCEVINHSSKGNWITVFYEQLVLDPEKELTNLLKKMDLPYSLKDFGEINYKKPSQSNYLNEYNRNSKMQLESFLKDFEESYLRKIQVIFDYFDFKTYDALTAYPHI
ncbi:sulfotransferase family protein [Bizionia paragorgiae]|uniref:sulfotransferase family protein n=1 Tax=Bizionia paragorgiae TaxID=283786 RepID=UPI003A8CD092